MGLILTVIGAIIRMEQRMSKALTREEHERICMERNARVERQLSEMREDFQSKHEENRETFDRIATATSGTHKLILDLYRDLLNQRGQR